MKSSIATYTLLVALVFSLLALGQRARGFRLPGDQQGYEPVQPIAFSHRLHAGDLEIDCHYCHSGAERSRHAGIPATGTCMNCHRFVTASWGAVREENRRAQREERPPRRLLSPEIAKLYGHLGLDPNGEMGPGSQASPLSWIRIHSLPDFAYFDHRAHSVAGLGCPTCHGPVETMERVRQQESLSMGWCVNCHRQTRTGIQGAPVEASLDCSTCHY